MVALMVAVQEAATLAPTCPLALIVILLMVTPAPLKGVAVTLNVLAGWSASLTVAICETVAGLPCCRVTAAPLLKQSMPTKFDDVPVSAKLFSVLLSAVFDAVTPGGTA